MDTRKDSNIEMLRAFSQILHGSASKELLSYMDCKALEGSNMPENEPDRWNTEPQSHIIGIEESYGYVTRKGQMSIENNAFVCIVIVFKYMGAIHSCLVVVYYHESCALPKCPRFCCLLVIFYQLPKHLIYIWYDQRNSCTTKEVPKSKMLLSKEKEGIPAGQPEENEGIPAGQPEENEGILAGQPEETKGIPTGKPREDEGMPTGKPEDNEGILAGKKKEKDGLLTNKPEESKAIPASKPEETKCITPSENEGIPAGQPEETKSIPIGKRQEKVSIPAGKLEEKEGIPASKPEESKGIPTGKPELNKGTPTSTPEPIPDKKDKFELSLLPLLVDNGCTGDEGTGQLFQTSKPGEGGGEIKQGRMNMKAGRADNGQGIKIRHIILMIALLSFPVCANTISTSPSKDYTTFMENSSEFVFKCSGNGKYFKWTVDGYDTGMDYVRHRGIRVSSPLLSSSDEDSVSSLLTIPTTQNNSNITVKCAMFNETHYEWSNPVKLILQGKLEAPMEFEVASSGSNVTISWMAPFSLELSTPPSIFNYILSNSVTNSVTTISSAKCEPSMHCNYSTNLKELDILDYNGTVDFTLFAVNGAGNGNSATYVLLLTVNQVPTAGIPSSAVTTITPVMPAESPVLLITLIVVVFLVVLMFLVVLVLVLLCVKK